MTARSPPGNDGLPDTMPGQLRQRCWPALLRDRRCVDGLAGGRQRRYRLHLPAHYGSDAPAAQTSLGAVHRAQCEPQCHPITTPCGGTARSCTSIAAFGFKKNSYEAEVDGLFRVSWLPTTTPKPGTASIGRSANCDNASRNRSAWAFDCTTPRPTGPPTERGADLQVTVLRLRQAATTSAPSRGFYPRQYR